MKYDIYFHNDFDGVASAAILLKFLKNRGDDFSKCQPVDYPLPVDWTKLKFRNPTIIVDFIYHPKAKIWFDHHSTTFLKPSWEKKFRPDKFHYWDANSKSCAGLVLDKLVKNFGFKPPKYFKELVFWLDKFESADYASVEEAMDVKSPAAKIKNFLRKQKNTGHLRYIIKSLSLYPIKKVADSSLIKKYSYDYKKKLKLTLDFLKSNFEVRGKTVFVDESIKNIVALRYAAYYFYPKIFYSVRLTKDGDGFGLHAGSNPWRRPEKKIHIGEFLKKHYYGGGGHQYVGAAEFTTKQKALKAAKEVIDFLNKH